MVDDGWIGVDLDGTLAYYDGWRGIEHIGLPIPKMWARVKNWDAEGKEVRIFTARASGDDAEKAIYYIKRWCVEHDLPKLQVTCRKDFRMTRLFDDRAVQIIFNTGERVDGVED